jgi:hypothetical protein
MSPEAARTFDERLRSLVAPWSREGVVELQTMADIVWGHPLAG